MNVPPTPTSQISDTTSVNTANTTATTASSAMQKDLLTAAWTCVGSLVTIKTDGRCFTGRIFSYDYMSKMLVLKIVKQGQYQDTVLLNSRNISDITQHEEGPLTKAEITREFSIGEISRLEQDRLMDQCNSLLEERKQYLLK